MALASSCCVAFKKHSFTAIISGIAVAGCISSANASGVKSEKPKPQASLATMPTPAQLDKFSGFYVGANLDYGFATRSANVGCISPELNFSFSPNCQEAIAAGALATHYTPSPSGFGASLKAGYDYRVSNVVLGLVTDIGKSTIRGSSSSSTNVPTFVPEFAKVTQGIDWFGTLRGRVGFLATHNFMPYITGGLAYGQVRSSYELNLPAATPAITASQSKTEWQAGWALGAGGELSFTGFSVTLEYLYYDVGQQTLSPIVIRGGVPQPTTSFPTKFDTKGNLFRLGANFPINSFVGHTH